MGLQTPSAASLVTTTPGHSRTPCGGARPGGTSPLRIWTLTFTTEPPWRATRSAGCPKLVKNDRRGLSDRLRSIEDSTSQSPLLPPPPTPPPPPLPPPFLAHPYLP